MRPTIRCRRLISAAMVFAALIAGCGRSPESVKVKSEISGPSDLTTSTKLDSRWHAYQLRTFQTNHIWAGPGYTPSQGERYRAKITLWDYADDASAVAEVYFHDPGQEIANPDPKNSKRPYQLHFPMTVFGPIIGALRNANEPVYLYYYENHWAVGIDAPEAVGVD